MRSRELPASSGRARSRSSTATWIGPRSAPDARAARHRQLEDEPADDCRRCRARSRCRRAHAGGHLPRRGLERLVVAYEPIWAIGTGNPATGVWASLLVRAIRAALKQSGLDADAIPVLYGGSVSARSVGEFAVAEGIDGALVGGASLDPDEFAAVVRAFA